MRNALRESRETCAKHARNMCETSRPPRHILAVHRYSTVCVWYTLQYIKTAEDTNMTNTNISDLECLHGLRSAMGCEVEVVEARQWRHHVAFARDVVSEAVCKVVAMPHHWWVTLVRRKHSLKDILLRVCGRHV